jgi:hypothetical protein
MTGLSGRPSRKCSSAISFYGFGAQPPQNGLQNVNYTQVNAGPTASPSDFLAVENGRDRSRPER